MVLELHLLMVLFATNLVSIISTKAPKKRHIQCLICNILYESIMLLAPSNLGHTLPLLSLNYKVI